MAGSTNNEMAAHAGAAAEMVRAEYGRDLDFTEPTVGAVEALLNGLSTNPGESIDFLGKAALLFGAYLGELIRARYPKAVWISGSMTPNAPPPFLRLGDMDVSPIVWCFKRLHNGPKDNVVQKFVAFRQAAAERGHDF